VPVGAYPETVAVQVVELPTAADAGEQTTEVLLWVTLTEKEAAAE
jgi:hypothetical protein